MPGVARCCPRALFLVLVFASIVLGCGGQEVHAGSATRSQRSSDTGILEGRLPGRMGVRLGRVTRGRPTQAAGTVHDRGFFAKAGQAFYFQSDGIGRNRWGDSTATAFSYATPNSYWSSGKFSQSDGGWGTVISTNGYMSVTHE